MFKKNLSLMALLAVSSFAQTTPAKAKTTAPVTPASQTVSKGSTAPAQPATKAATGAKPMSTAKPASTLKAPSTTKPATVAKTASKPVQKKATPAQVKADIQAKAEKPAAAKESTTPVRTAGRRDPFVSPLRIQEDNMKSSSVCTTGARCLIVDQVILKGIVKTPQGMIAMVENPSQKQYNLREKDPVYNGQVVKITGDSVIFRETVIDNLGKQTTREVVKKVTAPVI
jgi:Tfp pilus assembly protein PilP